MHNNENTWYALDIYVESEQLIGKTMFIKLSFLFSSWKFSTQKANYSNLPNDDLNGW